MQRATKPVRCHILSIRDQPEEELLIQQAWEGDAEVEIIALHSGADALAYLQTPARRLPSLFILATEFPAKQMTTLQTLYALKSDPFLRCVPVIVMGRAIPQEKHIAFMKRVRRL